MEHIYASRKVNAARTAMVRITVSLAWAGLESLIPRSYVDHVEFKVE
jgi:hypothetical protein